MVRLNPTRETLRSLFAKSGNRCAFPGCAIELINEDNTFVGQICHIEAARVGGERFNQDMSDDERRSHANLILLCYQHHVETNDVAKFSVEKLREIKARHETNCGQHMFKIDESQLYKLAQEMNDYWSNVEDLHQLVKASREFPIEILAAGDFFEIFNRLKGQIKWVLGTFRAIDESEEKLSGDLYQLLDRVGIDKQAIEKIPYYENPFEMRNWELRKIGFRNIASDLQASLAHIEIKFLEEFLKTNPGDSLRRERLKQAKAEFEMFISESGYVD